ncbi:hypothetical protein J3Q64DRAFT_1701425 [Phycomyces blakesleeanus]|uniref:Uncharacterized protein n=2 Tax=Phycomyces blakesleeanus TaxID=4837 RepID=A0A162ZVK2_PHYB8|nr:hypothetical protein PHYBLDRAFT_172542 [Phycomyces blakesleeanus NRRL 1555(-)]OAD69291.1 hypothetical protein PHYBLDRAFT_172542 [Phycomyces blakesleeanus NRRL 1555(-)]|eukprot:XP_018287331.1 hypothetical protein PHYBLDRAFT_172542 [Phycomyces blakesleeanus NRRL 1555(-)]
MTKLPAKVHAFWELQCLNLKLMMVDLTQITILHTLGRGSVLKGHQLDFDLGLRGSRILVPCILLLGYFCACFTATWFYYFPSPVRWELLSVVVIVEFRKNVFYTCLKAKCSIIGYFSLEDAHSQYGTCFLRRHSTYFNLCDSINRCACENVRLVTKNNQFSIAYFGWSLPHIRGLEITKLTVERLASDDRFEKKRSYAYVNHRIYNRLKGVPPFHTTYYKIGDFVPHKDIPKVAVIHKRKEYLMDLKIDVKYKSFLFIFFKKRKWNRIKYLV